MNEEKLNRAIEAYKENKDNNNAYFNENWKEREERRNYYQSFDAERLLTMTEDEFLEYISKLWSMLIWGNKKYVVDKIILDNGFVNVKKQLVNLLYGSDDLETRWNDFVKDVKGLGPATVSELLSYVNPKEYVIFNKTTVLCYSYLGIPDMPKYNYQYTGKKYREVCAIAKEIAEKMEKSGIRDVDLLVVDYLLWDEILPLVEKNEQEDVSSKTMQQDTSSTTKNAKSMHDEIKEKLVDCWDLTVVLR